MLMEQLADSDAPGNWDAAVQVRSQSSGGPSDLVQTIAEIFGHHFQIHL